MTAELVIRPRRREDDPSLVDIFNQHEQSFRMTVESWRFHMDERVRPEDVQPLMSVAVQGERILGNWYLDPHAWVADPGVIQVAIQVERGSYGQGIGGALWDDVEPVVRDRKATKVYSFAEEGDEHAARFASKRGFSKTGRAERMSRLMVAEANLDGYDGIEERLANDGIEIKPVSEIDTSAGDFMSELYAAGQAAVVDIPSSEETEPTPKAEWIANFLKSPNSSPKHYFVALHDGHPIGIANLMVFKDSRRAANGLTGVVREFRGRGVARALKLRTIDWSRAHGIESIDTGNDAENARMLAINIRLGYKPLPAREEWLKLYE